MITNWNTLALVFYLVCHLSASSAKSCKVLLLLAMFTGMLLTLLSFSKLLFQLLLHSAFPFSLPRNAARASQECPNTSWISVFSENFCPFLVVLTVGMCLSWPGLPDQSLSGEDIWKKQFLI